MAGYNVNLNFEPLNYKGENLLDSGVTLAQWVGIYFLTRTGQEKPYEEAKYGKILFETGIVQLPTDELGDYFKNLVIINPNMGNELKYQILEGFVAIP
jgi:hypothetical protein